MTALVCALAVALGGSSFAAERNPQGREFPQFLLGARARGSNAVAALGARLPEFAAFYGKSPEQLRQILQRDRSLWADRQGRLHYVCEGLTAPAEGAVDPVAPDPAHSPLPPDQTFELHSRPGAGRTIYLDFDGHVTAGTSWNSSYTQGANIVTPAYDLDGNPAEFSATEIDRIQYIWQRVSEDFAMLDVDVTTEDPGVEFLRKSGTGDTNYGVRVCIGGSCQDWYKSSAGGVAYVACFAWSSDTPCFVFPNELGSGNEKYVAEAVSHEVGHTLGLHHDGKTDGTTYYDGHGTWAPIMGSGYNRQLTQWSKGEYALANNTEDDLTIMQAYAPQRPDDHGNDLAHATALSPTGTNISAAGVIEYFDDADCFRFQSGAGAIALAVVAAPRSPNLDVLLALYDGSGNLVTSTNAAALDVALSLTVSSGTYYVMVEGVGTGDPVTGYSNYGCLGQYTLTGSIVPYGKPPPGNLRVIAHAP